MIWLGITIFAFLLADWLYRKAGRRAYMHPVLLPTLLLVGIYAAGGFELSSYQQAVTPLATLLAVAVVGLAIPLYRSWGMVRRNRGAVFAALAGGSVAGVLGALAPAVLLGAPSDLVASLATKSITTPIAVTISGAIGGLPSIASAVVVVTGLVAALIGPAFLRLLGVDDEFTVGLAMGTAGHAIGTAEAARLSDTMAAAAAFSMTVNGLATALLLPLVWPLLV